MKTQFPDMSENPSNLLVILAKIIARNENARDYDTVQRYAGAYISTATGFHLDKAVRTAGITRLAGRTAVGKITITKKSGVAQVILSANTLVKSNNLEYMTTNKSTIIINSESQDIEIKAVEPGEIYNISSNSKFNTVQNIAGIESIIAKEDITGGTNTETDPELRERYYARMSGYSNSSLRGIIDRVSALKDVLRVDGDENSTSSETKGLLPHSFIIYVDGGTEDSIANSIMDSKPAGIQTNGTVVKKVTVSGREHEIRFSRFENQTVFYDVEVVIDRTVSSPDFISNLKKELVEYTARNHSIVSYELSNHISKTMKEVKGVKKLNFGLSENPTTNNDLNAEIGKIFFTDSEKIKVVVI